MKHLTSRDNPRLKQLRRWASHGRSRREAGVILLDGLHLIHALLDAGGVIEQLIVSESGLARPEISGWLLGRPPVEGNRGDDSVLLPDTLFGEIAATETPSGILAVARGPTMGSTIDAGSDALVLDGVQDPGNVGTLLRTAAAAGVRQAWLGGGCADPWGPKALRAGQGAQFELAIHEHCDLPALLGAYRGTSIVTRLDAANPLYETDLAGPLAWVFGAEGQGVSALVAEAATLGVVIPMPGRVESLNVAAAAAICLFEMIRRRR